MDDGKEIRKVGPLPASITALCFRNDAGQLAVAGDDKVIRVLAAGDGKTVKEIKGHGDRITSLAFAPLDGNQVFSGSTDKTARLWNVNEARVVREFSGHSDAVLAVPPSRDGSKLATGSADRTARLWNVGDSKLVATLSGHGGPVLSAAASGDGKLVATGSADQVVRFWDASTGRELERLSAHQGAITGVAILPDNASVVSSAADGAIRVWKPAAVRIFTGHEGPTHAVVAHPIGSQVTTGSADKSAKVFDLNNGNLIRSLAGHSDAVRAVVVSGDGTRVVTAGNDRTVRFWNAGDGNNVLVLPGLPAPALSLAASSDSKLAAAGLELEDGSTRVSDLTATDAAKTELQTFTPGAGAGPIAAVAFLAEPLALLTGGGDRSLKLWTVIAPGAGRTLSGHGNQVYSAAWSPDGKRLATGAADKTVRQRDMVKMTQVRKLSERKLKMFPDDHRQIVSARVVMVGNAFRIEVASATLP